MGKLRTVSRDRAPARATVESTPVAAVHGLVKEYDGRRVVDGLDLAVNAGEIVALVGPNGSGKTTSMECLVGLRRPTAGRVEILSEQVVAGGDHRLLVGVQLQQSGLPPRLRVGEAFASVAALYREPADVDAIMAALSLTELAAKPVDKLSGGQQRRVDIGLALVGDPALLVLDEPTSGVDPEARAELWSVLRSASARERAVLVSTHDLGEAEDYADRVVVLRAGRVVLQGRVDEVIAAAGHDWRLRLVEPDADAVVIMRAAVDDVMEVGTSVLALGEREVVQRLRKELEMGRDDRRVRYRDLVAGPVRLEDLFVATAARAPEVDR